MKMLVAQSCSTLCNPMNCSPLGSSVLGISQARKLERVVMSFSRGSSPPGDLTCVSCIGRRILYHLVTWEAQRRACVCLVAQSCPTLCDSMEYNPSGYSLSKEFSRQECWNRLSCPSPGDLPNPGMEPGPPMLQADSLPSEPSGFPESYNKFPLALYFTYGSVCVSMLLSPFIPP